MLWGKRLNKLWHLWKISCGVNHVSIKPCTTSLRAAVQQCTWPVQYKVPLSVWWTSHLPNPKYKLLHPNMSMFSRSSWMILSISLWLDHNSLKWLVCRISWPWSGLAVWWSAAAEKRTISDELWSERHLHTHPCSSTTRGFWDLQMLCIQQSGTGAVLCQTHRATPEHQIYNVKLEENQIS